MGVRMLNRYLREFSSSAMKQITMNELRGKKIAIDVSIFMYQFKGNEKLLESMYNMIMLFRDYNVIPVFIFDGAPPDEKLEVLNERDASKKHAKEVCKKLENELRENEKLDNQEKKRIEIELNNEKKKCLRITNANIRSVKELMNVLGVNYLVAEGEADDLCVYLVKKRIVWACMTEDMDMFVYGCQRVLRNFNLEKGTMTLYSMIEILKNLNMNQFEFRDVCLLAGTDYNRSKYTIYTSMGYFYKYLKKKKDTMGFYDWLKFTKIINSDDITILKKSRDIFTKVAYNDISLKLTNKRILKEEVEDYMKKYDINYLTNV